MRANLRDGLPDRRIIQLFLQKLVSVTNNPNNSYDSLDYDFKKGGQSACSDSEAVNTMRLPQTKISSARALVGALQTQTFRGERDQQDPRANSITH